MAAGRLKWRIAAWVLAATALFAAGLRVASYLMAPVAPQPATQFVRAQILPPTGHSFTPNDFAISPDGRRVASIAAGADGVATLWVTSLESGRSSEIADSEAAESPFWSPDNRWIAFFAGGKLMKVEPGPDHHPRRQAGARTAACALPDPHRPAAARALSVRRDRGRPEVSDQSAVRRLNAGA